MVQDQSDPTAVEFELDSVPHIIVDRFLVPIRFVFSEWKFQFRIFYLQRQGLIQRERVARPKNDTIRIARSELEFDLELVSCITALERVSLKGLSAEPLTMENIELGDWTSTWK